MSCSTDDIIQVLNEKSQLAIATNFWTQLTTSPKRNSDELQLSDEIWIFSSVNLIVQNEQQEFLLASPVY